MTCKQYILQNWKKKTVKMMVADGLFSAVEIRTALRALDITPVSEKDLKVSFVLDNYKRLCFADMAQQLDCNIETVRKICSEYELTPPAVSAQVQPVRQSFWDRIRKYELQEAALELFQNNPDWEDVDDE